MNSRNGSGVRVDKQDVTAGIDLPKSLIMIIVSFAISGSGLHYNSCLGVTKQTLKTIALVLLVFFLISVVY